MFICLGLIKQSENSDILPQFGKDVGGRGGGEFEHIAHIIIKIEHGILPKC